jgi:crotonobetainyl-CoA:carnitine CoA-transferase CaiB-like acyl-CoA transferase
MMGDLGADVIKIEPIGGDRARRKAPFYGDSPHEEKSLYWFAFNANKRGITLNLETVDGRKIFKELVASSDVVIESFDVGYMKKLRLGYSMLKKINPQIILTSISPFGQKSIVKDYKADDLIAQALSTVVHVTGDADRPPVRLGAEQSYAQVGSYAAAATMIALYQRGTKGSGQHVDVSIVQSMSWGAAACLGFVNWELEAYDIPRMGTETRRGHGVFRQMFRCKDGHIRWRILTGGMGRRTQSMVELMSEEGMAENLTDIDWDQIDLSKIEQKDIDEWEGVFAKFFAKHTKKKLYEEAVKRSMMLFPVARPKEIAESPQLQFRNYFTNVEHPELGKDLLYPGPLFRSSEGSPKLRYRAPLIGEHNEAIFKDELGYSQDGLLLLKQAGVI